MSKKSRRQNVTVATPVVAEELSTAADATTTSEVVSAPETTETEQVVAAAADTPAVAEVAAAEAPAVAPAADTPPASPPKKKYPREGGKCWLVWNAADQLVAAGQHPTVKDLMTIGAERGWNPSNTSQEFYAWRKFHGRR